MKKEEGGEEWKVHEKVAIMPRILCFECCMPDGGEFFGGAATVILTSAPIFKNTASLFDGANFILGLIKLLVLSTQGIYL